MAATIVLGTNSWVTEAEANSYIAVLQIGSGNCSITSCVINKGSCVRDVASYEDGRHLVVWCDDLLVHYNGRISIYTEGVYQGA